MARTTPHADVWGQLAQDLEGVLKSREIRPEITLDPAPAPARLATHAAAILADVIQDGDEVGGGRLVVLYEPEFQTAWDGNIRCVAFVRADLESELVTDPLLLDVGWSWATDALNQRKAHGHSVSGTVSRAGSKSFGDIAEREPEGSVEIRISWTVPDGESLHNHVLAWCDLLALAAGLPPLIEGVVSITRSGSA